MMAGQTSMLLTTRLQQLYIATIRMAPSVMSASKQAQRLVSMASPRREWAYRPATMIETAGSTSSKPTSPEIHPRFITIRVRESSMT